MGTNPRDTQRGRVYLRAGNRYYMPFYYLGDFMAADTTNSAPPQTVAVTLYLDPEIKRRIDALKPMGFTLNGFIRAAIGEHLRRHAHLNDPETIARHISHV